MLNVTFLGEIVLVKESAESRYAIEHGLSLEDAIAEINASEVYDENEVIASLTFLLGRAPTQDEIDACEWTQVPLEVIESADQHEQNRGTYVLQVGPGREYLTIQSAIDEIGNAANLADNQTPWTILVDAGCYDEDITLPKGRIISLIALGTVVLGNGLGTNWSSTNSRSITWPSDQTTSYGLTAPRPGLTIGTVGLSDATSTFISQANCWKISGGLTITGDGLTNTLVLHSVELSGALARAYAGMTNIIASHSIFKSTITGPSISLARMDSCQFDALVTVNDYNSLVNCEVKAGMTVSAVGNGLPPSGMFHTTFTGVFTGPANSFRVDNITDYFATANGATLGGSATKVLLSSATGGGAWGSITGTLSNQTDLQSALDAKATTTALNLKSDKALTLNAQTANYTLVLTDADSKFVRMNVASANTLTVPPNSSVAFPVGTQINFSQAGAGQVTVTPGAGVTINSADSGLKTRVQYSVGGLIKVATDTWTAFGDLTA